VKILVLIGSLRADSLNRRLADAAIAHLPAHASAVMWNAVAELPHYSEDLDGAAVPARAAQLREAVQDADALLIVTPEYNGSLPGSLKNAIDWLSRPRGKAALAGKPTAVLAASASHRGAQWAREDAVRILQVAGAAPLTRTVGVGSAWEAFTENGLADGELDAALRSLVSELTGQAVAA
jgi:NAD(P)H-dependent FMN reductase